MNELTKAIADAASAPNDDGGAALTALNNAGVAWAEFCLRHLRGKLQRRGLAISAAISAFDCELQFKDQS